MVQNYTPVMWDDKAFAFVPYEAFSDLPHYPKEKCEQICKELNSLIRLCTYRPKKEDIYFHPILYLCDRIGYGKECFETYRLVDVYCGGRTSADGIVAGNHDRHSCAEACGHTG